ncbi:MAG: GDSL-type esterase/lipase family protein [Candidatus Woesearchaeota archaeon]
MANLCVFGDSTVWGAWDDVGGWVARLRRYLDIKTDGEMIVYNCGVSGDNTDDLLERFETEAKAREPGIIIISIGANDSTINNSRETKGYNGIELDKFKWNILQLIKLAGKFTDKIAFVGLMPVDESKTTPLPWNITMSYTNENCKKYNSAVKEACKDILFIDLFEEWSKLDYKGLLDDGLHPNSKGHEVIFETVKESLEKNGLL